MFFFFLFQSLESQYLLFAAVFIFHVFLIKVEKNNLTAFIAEETIEIRKELRVEQSNVLNLKLIKTSCSTYSRSLNESGANRDRKVKGVKKYLEDFLS